MAYGDNKNSCHNLKDLLVMGDHWLGYCMNCKKRYHLKSGDKKRMRELFRKDTLQPGTNLYYKYYGKMNTL